MDLLNIVVISTEDILKPENGKLSGHTMPAFDIGVHLSLLDGKQ